MNVSEVGDGCRAAFIGLTSWPEIKHDMNNISLSDFHQAILYGFELSYPRFGHRMSIFGWILWTSQTLLEVYITCSAAKFVIGLPFIIAFLVYKFKRRHLSIEANQVLIGMLNSQSNLSYEFGTQMVLPLEGEADQTLCFSR
ncbi:hypothetical protein HAX54_045736 [Datura stramonium]|uniref:Uncharacterized protein n=1 Tax=Datura stramonium TaxID=4076 RepID=A0ABS8WJS2_DATST|nr:hypothetical protein [Datura stramonium]